MKKIVLCLLVSFGLILVGCSAATTGPIEEVKSVSTITAEKIIKNEYLYSLGSVSAKNVVKYSFKSTANLKKINVAIGDIVEKGDILAALDTSVLKKASQAKTSIARGQLSNVKALEDSYNDMLILYENGAVSKASLDALKYKLDTTRSGYVAAMKDAEISSEFVVESELIAKDDGVVVEILYEENELIPAGYPCVIIRSSETVVKTGITMNDIDQIELGCEALVSVNKSEFINGVITYIGEIPDMTTRMYDVEITLTDKQMRIGLIADVKIDMGKSTDIWIPISAVLKGSEEYVYVAKDERVYKQIITIIDVEDIFCKVNGIEPGDVVVTTGMQYLSEGSKVNIDEYGMQYLSEGSKVNIDE